MELDERFPFVASSGPDSAPAPRYGGFWIRLAAYLIDSVVLAVPAQLVQAVLGRGAAVLWIAVGIAYFAGFESSPRQATVGKMACGLIVTDLEGRRISFGRATGRYLAQILDVLTLGIGYAMIGWTARKQGLHDKVADTLVLKGRPG